MAAADPGTPDPRDDRRERPTGLLVLGVAVVLLVSSVSWFGTGKPEVGILQVFLGVVLAAVGGFLYWRSARG